MIRKYTCGIYGLNTTRAVARTRQASQQRQDGGEVGGLRAQHSIPHTWILLENKIWGGYVRGRVRRREESGRQFEKDERRESKYLWTTAEERMTNYKERKWVWKERGREREGRRAGSVRDCACNLS